jgi:hypothetical protein
MKSFSEWKKLYDQDDLEAFNYDQSGLTWLKLKSISKQDYLKSFLKENNLSLDSKTVVKQFEELYDLTLAEKVTEERINHFLQDSHRYSLKILDEEKLISELYKVKFFNWGGDYKNSLDKHLVDRYVKVIQSYDELEKHFDDSIYKAVVGYVTCSWYNHWSSILIENIFKSHSVVLPTAGQIKKVDFFINNIPFDLKVTYLPKNYIESERKLLGLKSELSELKSYTKEANINFDNNAKSDLIYYEIIEKMKDKNDVFCNQALNKIQETKLKILENTINNPKKLIQNFYEQQGEVRFDSSNRLFLVLIDREDFDNSWKLKRNLNLLKPSINQYLNCFAQKNISDMKIEFEYKGKNNKFTALSDILFVLK